MLTNQTFKYKECHEAALAGDLTELKKFHENGIEWGSLTPTYASMNGHLDCLKYCFENGCDWDVLTPAYAALNGHLDCLKFVHENGIEWDMWTTVFAAENGHLECLKYAHENGCQWESNTPKRAAENGHFECLKYAHDNGCPWDYKTPLNAAIFGYFECFKYCFEEWNNPQEFWNHDYNLTQIIYKINLDDPVWRKLFTLDLSKNPQLQNKVNAKKQEIETLKAASKDALQNTLPMDVIKYCLQPFF